jgi:hypothetical protein
MLKTEIEASSITQPLEGIEAKNASSSLTFADVLTSGEQTTLDGIVAAHPTLDSIKATRKSQLQSEAWTYLNGRYDCDKSRVLHELFMDTFSSGKTNRRAYIATYLTWVVSIGDHVVAKMADVDAAADAAAVAAVVLNTAAMTAGDPGVTIPAALAIPD